MIDPRLKYLYNQYLNDQCSPAELEELKQLLRQAENEEGLKAVMEDAWYEIDEAGLQAMPAERAESIFKKASKKKNNNRWWMRAAAAVIILLSGWSIGAYVQKKQSTSQFANSNITAQRIEPGSNKATLQLANGKQIILNDIPTGKDVQVAGMKIIKTAAGKVIYQVDQHESSEAINTITTPRGGEHEIVLADGSKVWLNASSSLRFPVAFNKNNRTVELNGEAYFEIAKDASKPFSVNANGTTIAVLGTSFNINAYNDNPTVTATLLDGSVKFKKAGKEVLLTPGQQGIVFNNGSDIKVAAADIEKVMGWKNGYFVFRDENIAEIMKQVSRWYNVDIEFDGDLSDREFGGTVSRYKNITELLDNMQLTKTIHYKIDGKKVIIMK